MRFSKKVKYLIIVLLLVVSTLLAICKWYVLPILMKYPSYPPSKRMGINCDMVAKTLRLYYEERYGNVPENPIPGFVNYLIDIDPLFSRQAPVAPYTSDQDMSFYLLLPRKLESSASLLIAYTSPFTKNKGEVYRCALFLQGEKIAIQAPRESILKGIVGKETFEEKIPDFYIWKRRSKYLRDQSDKDK